MTDLIILILLPIILPIVCAILYMVGVPLMVLISIIPTPKRKPKPVYNNPWEVVEELNAHSKKVIKSEVEFYHNDRLEAYDRQIEANYDLLKHLNIEYRKTEDNLKRATIRKKQADIMARLARMEEQAYKLREKLGL